MNAVYQRGQLVFGSGQNPLNLAQLLESYAGPKYIYDLATLEDRYQMMKKAFSDKFHIHYAVKANPHPGILQTLKQLGSGFDVVSGGEIQRVLQSGAEASQIIFSGVGKTVAEIKMALLLGVQQINVESLSELHRIVALGRELKLKSPVAVALRMNPDVNAETHPYITTGFRENKFGIDPAYLDQCFEILKSNPSVIRFVGLSMHIGSQLLTLEALLEAADRLLGLAHACERAGFPCEVLDFGGGVGVYYDHQQFAREEALMAQYGKQLSEKVKDFKGRCQLEPGRWLIAHAGVLLAQVQYIKETEAKRFAILDTGMHHLMRPALYQAFHRILQVQLPVNVSQEKLTEKVYDFVGPICESSDFLGRDRVMAGLKEGDLVALLTAGAYGASMASHYNLHEMPQEILIK